MGQQLEESNWRWLKIVINVRKLPFVNWDVDAIEIPYADANDFLPPDYSLPNFPVAAGGRP